MKHLRKLFAGICGLLLLATMAAAADETVVVGTISEISDDKQMIQVGKYIMETGVVMTDDGVSEPKYAGKYALEEGALVQAWLTSQKGETWLTEKVVVLIGRKRQEVLPTLPKPE